MSVERRGARWIARVYAADGSRLSRGGFTTKEAAKKAERELLVKRDQDLLGAPVQDLSFEEYSRIYLNWARQHKRSWKSDQSYVRSLLRLLADRRLSSIGIQDVQEYQRVRLTETARKRKTKITRSTCNRELAILHAMLRRAISWGYLDRDRLAGLRLTEGESRRERVLTPQQSECLLAEALPHWRPLIGLALETGMRRGELLALRWDAPVDLAQRFARVRAGKTRSAVRDVPLSQAALAILQELQHRDGLVIRGAEGARFYWRTETWAHLLMRAKLPGLRFHDLRHTFATRSLAAGVDVITLQRILGHASTRMLSRYSHPTSADLLRAIDRLDAVATGVATDALKQAPPRTRKAAPGKTSRAGRQKERV